MNVLILTQIRLLFSMLPQLNKKKSMDVADCRNSQPKLDGPNNQYKDYRTSVKSVSAKKVRTGGGFMKSNIIEQPQLKQMIAAQKIAQHQNLHKFVKVRRAQDLSAQIKLIEKKIKACQKKLEEDRRKQRQIAEQAENNNNKPDYNFQKVVKRELQMQGYKFNSQQMQQNFDYLTNPKLQPGQIEQEQPQPVIEKKLIIQATHFSIESGVEKLQKFYQNSLKKKFERRQMFPHQACKRKTPKLYITQKTNALSKYGRAQNEQQHLFRVLTKQTTPQQIYPTIPNFAVVKDNLSKNIVAYLGDYKPFLDKTKEVDTVGGSLNIKEKSQQEESQRSEIVGNKAKNFKQNLRVNAPIKTKTNQKQKTQA